MRSLPFALTLSLTLACATTSQPVDTKPEADVVPDAGSDADLASAFEPQKEKAPVAPVRPPPLERVDRAADFKSALADAQAALKAKRLDDARQAITRALTEAKKLDGEARFQAHSLSWKVSNGEPDTAEQAARAWLDACGPEKLDACRAAALGALASAAKVRGADRKLIRQAQDLKDAETCSVKAEKLDKPAPCEAAAARTARAEKDDIIALRLQLATALREADADKQVRLLEKAEGACTTPQCSGLRRKALGKLIAHARKANDADQAVKLALREVALLMELAHEDDRRWVRTGTLDQTCVSYDTAHAVGACRLLEKKTLGQWTFHDYSKDSAGEGLSADTVRAVNEHFAPLLQECLAEQAKRMMPPDAQRFEVRWVVFNDGRVGEAHLRRDLDQTPLANCLRAQFVWWRYPRYEGEYQNVEQSFTVTASERRIR